MVLGPECGPEILIPVKREENRNAPLKCPRCDSANTKFCYYNNYSRSQPRHFCRSCSRYWTEGGALRNVPVGGIRKNKRRNAISGGGNPATAISPAAPGGLEGAVFQDIGCRQVFRSPPEPSDSPSVYSIEGLFDSPLPHTPLTFMKDFGGGSLGLVWSGGMAAASSSSCSSSPSHYSCRGYDIGGGGGEDGLLGMMDAPRGSAWVKEETALPSSYWDFWHDVAGFTGDGGR